MNLGFSPKKLIGYTVDDTQASTLAVEVMYFNIWENDDIVHRRAVSRYYDYVMGDAPTRIVITDTGFIMKTIFFLLLSIPNFKWDFDALQK